MNADQAFDNLQNQNAFSIPAAGRGVSPHGVEPEEEQEPSSGAMRVDELFERPDEYRPAASSGESGRGSYANPTETDLEPVDDEELDSAHVQGARIIGRDTEIFDDDLEPTRARVLSDAEAGDEEYEANPLLSGARRVRRFAYLPVAGIEEFETSVRELTSRLRAEEPDRPSLMITSAARGEGRTELAIRMSLALARKVGSRIALVDFDVRRPKAGPRLGISTKYFTLRDVLAGACDLAEALVVSEEDNLYVLPSRASDRGGDEVLDDEQVESLMEQLHAAFEFVFLDCGPVSQADVLLLGRHVGFAAVAGMCGTSLAPRMNQTAEKLAGAGARVAGLSLAGA